MCYSGKCIWEQSSGDCGFPTIKEVKDKYPLPLCTIFNGDENPSNFEEMIADVEKIVNNNKQNNMEYSDGDIRTWAKQIRENKIVELKESIDIYEKIIEGKTKEYANPERYKKIVIHEIDKLKEKLEILSKK